MKKIKVLIVSVLAGSGHNSAADLLKQYISAQPNFEVVRYTNPGKMLDRSYNSMTKYTPVLFNSMIRFSPRVSSDFLILGKIDFVSDAVKQLNEHNPDIVIATYYAIAHSYKVASWITGKYPIIMSTHLDYGKQYLMAIPYNIYLRSDYTIVYDQKAYDSIRRITKQKDDYIILNGHDCREEFKAINKENASREVARKTLKINNKEDFYQQISTDKTTILIAGGGGGTIQKTYKLLKAIAKEQKKDIHLLEKYQIFIICGQNKGYFEKLKSLRNKKLSWQNIFPFGWLDATGYALVQRASDYPVLFGIAPATMHELLETKCGPLIIHKVRANHEYENVKFVTENGLGSLQKDQSEVVETIINGLDGNAKKDFVTKADNILETEEARLKLLPERLVEIYKQKGTKSELIYDVSLFQKAVSVVFVIITFLAYYIAKIIYWIKEQFFKGIAYFKALRG